MSRLFFISSLLLPPLALAGVNLSGRWQLRAGYDEEYDVTFGPSGSSFNVSCVAGPCSSWKTAVISVADEASRALAVAFDSGVKDSGVANADAATAIQWTSSAWARPAPPTPITVHVCPSSHMDPGWMLTADQLYESLFKFTILNVTAALAANPARTYAAEIAVVWAMFVGEYGVAGRETLRALVASGQLEFVGGGFVQPDEAITRFEDLLDERTLGHLFLSSVLGHAPVRVGYSADPFGHSATQAYVAALNAYDAHVIGRPMSPLDPVNAQFASVYHPLASAPDAGAFAPASSVLLASNLGYWEPYRSMDQGDVGKAAATLLSWARAAAARGAPAPARNILLILGDDVPLQTPWAPLYDHLDAVIAALNANSSSSLATFVYSTPSKWAAAAAAEGAMFPARPNWDMLPLVGNEFPFWTGYYISRPEFKAVYHAGSALFRAASALHALASDDRSWYGGVAALLSLWRAVAVAQHHDIITGDCFDAVAEDNALRVRAGAAAAGAVASAAAATVLAADGADTGAACTNLTLAPCAALVALLEQRAPAALTLFNPSGWPRTDYVTLLSPTPAVAVADASGAAVASQAEPFDSPDLPPGTAWWSIVFAAQLPPLGAATFILTATAVAAPAPAAPAARAGGSGGGGGNIVLSNADLTATFSPNGTLLSLQQPGGPVVAAVAKVLFYSSRGGSENAWDFSTDGGTAAFDFPGAASQRVVSQVAGALFQELVVAVDDGQGVALRYRLFAGEPHLHVFTSCGPFAANATSTDAILRLETSIASAGAFWTDSNGLELQPRARWARPFTSENYTGASVGNEPVAVNMYPVTATALLPDADASKPALALLTGNSHAATSMADGAIELTLNRNVVNASGARFTGNRRVTAHNLIALGAGARAAATASRRAAADLANPTLAFAAAAAPGGGAPPPFAPLAGAGLPAAVALVSLQLLPPAFNLSDFFVGGNDGGGRSAAPPPAADGALLLRLRHVYQVGTDDPALAAPATVDVAALFAPRWVLAAVTELVVDASEPMAAARAKQIQWQQQPAAAAAAAAAAPATLHAPTRAAAAPFDVTLAPMEIKTLLLTLA